MPPLPERLQTDGHALLIHWSDGVQHRLPWTRLREACPCAACRTKAEAPATPSHSDGLLPILSPAEAQPLRVLGMHPVGNYAYSVQFSDGHTSGIYTFEFLRSLGESWNDEGPPAG